MHPKVHSGEVRPIIVSTDPKNPDERLRIVCIDVVNLPCLALLCKWLESHEWNRARALVARRNLSERRQVKIVQYTDGTL